jgi:hypothetical protein
MCEQFFGKVYDVSSVIFSPHELGFAATRWRKYVVLLRRASLTWSLRYNQEHFANIFFRKCVLKDIEHYRADAAEIDKYMQHLAGLRHLPKRTTSGDAWPCEAVLNPSAQRRLQQYVEMLTNAQFDLAGSNFFVNLTQRPEFAGVSPSGHVPALLRHMLLWSTQAGRVMLPLEKMEVQGVPVFVDATFPRQCSWRHLLFTGQLSFSAVQALAGNAMHAGAVGTVLMYVLACSKPTRE